MNTVDAVTSGRSIRGREAGFFADLRSIAGRALRLVPRDKEALIPALVIPVFFFAVNIGQLQNVFEKQTGIDYKAFLLPLSIITTVSGVTRASALVTDIQGGYFDRLLLTPVRRITLLLGLMVADLLLVAALCVPVLALGFVVGVRCATGAPGLMLFIVIAALWGLACTGFPYALALKTGNPAVVNSSFLLFFPFTFLTTALVPEQALTPWFRAIARVNPVTYILAGLRSLLVVGWAWGDIGQAFLAIVIVAVVSITLAFRALNGRVKRK